MLIKEIQALNPPLQLAVQDGGFVYETHLVITEDESQDIVLIADYTNEDINVFAAQLDHESQAIIPTSDEVMMAVGEYIQAHSIEILTKEQIEEVAIHD